MPNELKVSANAFFSGPTLLQQKGPLIPIQIGLHPYQIEAMRQAKREIPSRRTHQAVALIDTGASGTCICETIAQELGLQKIDSTGIRGATSEQECPVYLAQLQLGPTHTFNWRVAGLPAGMLEFKCLLGRDVLRYYTLVYLGPEERFTLFQGVPQAIHNLASDPAKIPDTFNFGKNQPKNNHT